MAKITSNQILLQFSNSSLSHQTDQHSCQSPLIHAPDMSTRNFHANCEIKTLDKIMFTKIYIIFLRQNLDFLMFTMKIKEVTGLYSCRSTDLFSLLRYKTSMSQNHYIKIYACKISTSKETCFSHFPLVFV